MNEQLWLELPPISERAPRRLMVFLHGAGSSPEAFAPIALAWQLRFPGAVAILMQGLRRFGEVADWFDPRDADGQAAERARSASDTIAQRIVSVQQNVAVDAQRTVLIGHAQGATLALDMVRAHPALASIVGCCWWPRLRFLKRPACKVFRSSAACKAIILSLYRIFAVHSAFPARSVSALPPSADSHSRPLVEISVPAHWPD